MRLRQIRLLAALCWPGICLAGVIGTYTDKTHFVAAVGNQPLGQQNFATITPGLHTTNFQASGVQYNSFQFIQGQALRSFAGPSSFIGFDVLGGFSYIGFDYTSAG